GAQNGVVLEAREQALRPGACGVAAGVVAGRFISSPRSRSAGFGRRVLGAGTPPARGCAGGARESAAPRCLRRDG
ncbi:MAG TPA: hypothetical protein VIV12_03185, partial [Streptosporangiaceae bacterium]